MTPDEVIYLYQTLETNSIPTWIIGGWGIDALLGEQTRRHKDLDILVMVDDVTRLVPLIGSTGYWFAYLWEENQFTHNSQGIETATAFVWRDDAEREIDVHAMRIDELGNGIPAWRVNEEFQFPKKDLLEQSDLCFSQSTEFGIVGGH